MCRWEEADTLRGRERRSQDVRGEDGLISHGILTNPHRYTQTETAECVCVGVCTGICLTSGFSNRGLKVWAVCICLQPCGLKFDLSLPFVKLLAVLISTHARINGHTCAVKLRKGALVQHEGRVHVRED